MHAQAAAVYFSTFVELQPHIWGRPDPQDVGPEYRAVVGVPGGLAGPHGQALRAANLRNLSLVEDAIGHRADTLGRNVVYVMDAERFPAVQAELCLQLHDDALARYPQAYHSLNASFLRRGRLVPTDCPPNYICG